MKQYFIIFTTLFAVVLTLAACDNGSSGNRGDQSLPGCANGYSESYEQLRRAKARYNEIRHRHEVSENEKRAAAEAATHECVRHFESFGTANCNMNGRRAFDGDGNDIYHRCRSGQFLLE